jgi:hypothetical protein
LSQEATDKSRGPGRRCNVGEKGERDTLSPKGKHLQEKISKVLIRTLQNYCIEYMAALETQSLPKKLALEHQTGLDLWMVFFSSL